MNKLMEDPIMKQAFVLWEEVSRDPSKRYEYEARRKAILDHHSLIRDAELREKKAAAEADLNAKKGMAKKLLAIGMDETKILELTDLSEAELEELKKSPH